MNIQALPVASGQQFLWVRCAVEVGAGHLGRPGIAADWLEQRRNQHKCGGEPRCWSNEAQTEAETGEQR